MKHWIRRGLTAAGVVAVAGMAPLAAPAHAEPTGPEVPEVIAVPDGHKVFLVGHAEGVQIYRCGVTATGFGWGFVAPRADLFGENGQLVATHFGGPTWMARDGSAVVGQVEKRAEVPGTIPWLRLKALSTTVGAEGDRLEQSTFIQRTATTGGLEPPAAECTAETVGHVEEVPYTADYYFWKAAGD